MRPKFGNGNPLLERINDMRERAGMEALGENNVDEPIVEVIDKNTGETVEVDPHLNPPSSSQAAVTASDYAGEGGEFGGGGASDSWGDEEEGRGGLSPCKQPFYDQSSFFWGGLLAPIPFSAYQVYKRAIRAGGCQELLEASRTTINGVPVVNPSDPRLIQCMATLKEDATHLRCHGESLSSAPQGTLRMIARRQPWQFPLILLGAAAGGYHGHKKSDGWKTTVGWTLAGALLPLLVTGNVAYQHLWKNRR